MRNFVFRKVLYKKWQNSGMLFAIILLVGIVCSNPLYRAAVGQKMVCTNLDNTYEKSKINPGYVSASGSYVYGKETAITSKSYTDVTKLSESLQDMIQMPVISSVKHFELQKSFCKKEYSEDGAPDDSSTQIGVGYIEQLDKHVNVRLGKMYAEKQNSDGTYDCVMTHTVMQRELYTLGEKITLKNYVGKDGTPLVVKIVGVVEEKDNRDAFWTKPIQDYEYECFISPDALNSICSQLKTPPRMLAEAGLVFDYHEMKSKDVSSIYDSVKLLSKGAIYNEDIVTKITMLSSFESYYKESGKTSITMWMLQMPMMVLLLAFIFMTSRKIFETEKNEISMLASRGASRLKIVLLYLIQSSLLAGVGLMIGLLLAYAICEMIGCSNAFMEFVSRDSLQISYNLETLVYALGAAIVSICFVTLPVIQYSKIGIVELKRKKKKKASPVWYRYYLDIVLLVISIYLFRNMDGQREELISKVLSGKGIDPMFYLIAPLFMLGAGMFCFRLMHWIIVLVYKLGKKKWGPSSYTAFLYLIREGKAQWFISVFLILTIAMGIFNSNFARTINQNEQQRIEYNLGSDLVLQETWESNLAAYVAHYADVLLYYEPDYTKYEALNNCGVESKTKVYMDRNAVASGGNSISVKAQFMGIETKKFGETARLQEGLTKTHWYNYLNKLAQDDTGLIISQNLADKLNAKVGTEIKVERTNVEKKGMGTLSGKVCAIVDAWPSYQKYVTNVDDKGNAKQVENYLVVSNFTLAADSFDSNPYEIWMKTNGNSKKVYNFIKKNNIPVDSIEDIDTNIAKQKNDPFYQVTNGLLTISFVVVLVLSIVGFLIYWIISIRQRELLFGVYRAMGMSMKEVLQILCVEHIFSSLCSIAIGIGIGAITTKVFLPLVSLAYIPEKHVITMHVVTSPFDMVRLGVCIAVMLIVCFIVLGNILKKMKISQVLKLGED